MKFVCVCFTLGLCAAGYSQSRQAAANEHFQELASKASSILGSDPRQAIALSKQALALNPSWAEGWFNVGAASYQLGNYPEAANAFTHAGELAPQKGAVWAFLGLCDYELHDEPEAMQNFQKGESFGLPDNRGFVSTVRNRAASILIREKDFSGAIEQLRPLALLGDSSAETIEAFGKSALGFTTVPAGKEALVHLAGTVEWELCAGKGTEAQQGLQELLQQYANERGVHYLSGIASVAHDPQAANKEFERELQIDPGNVAARLQIAIIHIRAGEPERAIQPAREAVRLQPGNALAHAVLGRAEMQREHYPEALPELQRAAALAPLNPEIHLYLEQVYARLGKTTEAQTEKAKFVQLHSAQGKSSLPELASESSEPK